MANWVQVHSSIFTNVNMKTLKKYHLSSSSNLKHGYQQGGGGGAKGVFTPSWLDFQSVI